MAIDDNKDYTLKGSQVKDLAEKVKNAGKAFVATYNVTTAAELIAYLDSTKEPFAPILVKRGSDYYTAIISAKGNENVTVRVIGSEGGDFIFFTYTITGNTWANSSYSLQKKLTEGEGISIIDNTISVNNTIANKTYVNGKILEDLASYYTKTEADGLLADKADKATTYTKTEVDTSLGAKQDTLVSGTNIKTINNQSLLGEGNIDISGGGNANFTLDTTYDFATIQNQGQGISFQLDDANGVTITASAPGIYQNVKKLATQDYVDSKAGGTIDVVPGDDKFTVSDPDGLNSATLQVGGAGILMDISGSQVAELASKTYVDSHSGGTFVIDTANPCSYNELQNAINTPKAILIKHEGNVYPFVEKWESDENTKRYVNVASLQRQGVDKGAMYFFFEATIGDFDSPMVYSSNYAQPTGKPYTDSVAGNLANLTTTEKTNLVGAVNEVNGKVGVNFAVGKETWYGTYTDENNVTYQAYTKTIFIPALPATAGITTYPIGVSNMKQIIDIFGTTTDGFKLNAPRQTVSDNITVYQVSKGSQTFSIEVGKDRSNKSAYVTIIYAKNN